MKWSPQPYQLKAVKFMIERGVAGVFLDPGLGKTAITLAAFKVLKAQGMVKRMMVVAPLRVIHSTWPNEIWKWDEFRGMTYSILHGPEKKARSRIPADIYLVNPENFQRGDPTLPYAECDMLVIDESTKFKNSQSQRFKNLKKHLDRFRRRYILTGTPMPQGYEDLFAQVYLLDRGAALGEYITHFRREHYDARAQYGGYSEWELKEGHDKLILDKIAPFCLRMSAEDYLTLPELIENRVEVEMPPEARRVYDALEKEFIAMLSSGETLESFSAASLTTKLRQVCNGGAYNGERAVVELHDAKVSALADIVEEAGKPVLCAYQFVHDIERIRKHFKRDVPYIGGGVPEKVATRLINEFNEGSIPLLLAHPASAGHGLNLQESANHVVFFGLPWSLEEYDQFIRRVHRQGNPNSHVFLHILTAKDTVENAVVQALSAKDRTQKAFFEAITSQYVSR